jgi:hypothetical protein
MYSVSEELLKWCWCCIYIQVVYAIRILCHVYSLSVPCLHRVQSLRLDLDEYPLDTAFCRYFYCSAHFGSRPFGHRQIL